MSRLAAVRPQAGYSIVEVVAVLVILAAISTSIMLKSVQSSNLQLYAARDTVIAALSAAQQLAMIQSKDTQVVLGGNQLDVQSHVGGYTSVQYGGVQYPLDISPVTVLGPNQTINFNRLGQTAPATITLQHGSSTATITISASGYSQ